jgi:hypothetical protein
VPTSEEFWFAKVSGVATRHDQVGLISYRGHTGIAGRMAYSIDAKVCYYYIDSKNAEGDQNRNNQQERFFLVAIMRTILITGSALLASMHFNWEQ